MKKIKFDKNILLIALSSFLIGVGLGLLIYPDLVDWMPLASGIIILFAILLFTLIKK
ncbi:MAG: hypothetical protein QXO84_03555 [Candidatus Aenigmatarchaeota archaeon]